MTTQEGRLLPAMTESPPAVDKLAAALSKAQAKIEGATKDKTNPAFRSKYADLASVWDAIRAPLTENGLSVVQAPVATDGTTIHLRTILLHASGQSLTSDLVVKPVQTTPQGLGSALTYARRYALMAMVGVAPEDDDGNGASAARDSYTRETFRQVREERHSEPPDDEPPPPATPPGADVLTDNQKRFIWGAGKRLGAPADADAFKAWLTEKTGLQVVSLSEMTRPFASRVIDALKRLEGPSEAGR